MRSDAERIKEQVCSWWSLDSDYRGAGVRFTCQCGKLTGVYPDHASGQAQLDRHIDDQDEQFRRLMATHQKRWLPRSFGRRNRWMIV